MAKADEIYLGEGKYGECYLTKDDMVKKYYNKFPIPRQQFDTLGVENSSFVFASKVNRKEKYTLMRYVRDAVPFIIVKSDEEQKFIPVANPSFDSFIKAIPKLYADTDKLSKENIESFDCFSQNFLFGEAGFTIIDTDLYERYDFFDDYIEEANISNVNLGLADCIIYDTGDKLALETLFFKDPTLRDLYMTTFTINANNKTIIEYLQALKSLVENDEEIIDIFTFRKAIKERIRK